MDMEDYRINEKAFDDDDGRLLASFFAGNVADVPDDGFTERVMQRLPRRRSRASRVWTWFCAIAGVVFLFVTKSWLVPYTLAKGALEAVDLRQILQTDYAPYIVALLVISVLTGYFLAEESRGEIGW